MKKIQTEEYKERQQKRKFLIRRKNEVEILFVNHSIVNINNNLTSDLKTS